MTKIRWTRKEVRLAKDALLSTKGNKTEAAAIVSELTGRTKGACMLRLCKITDTYPALKKRNIERRMAKSSRVMMVEQPPVEKKEAVVKRQGNIEFHNDHIRIYF